jgi:hypothetical protein
LNEGASSPKPFANGVVRNGGTPDERISDCRDVLGFNLLASISTANAVILNLAKATCVPARKSWSMMALVLRAKSKK